MKKALTVLLLALGLLLAGCGDDDGGDAFNEPGGQEGDSDISGEEAGGGPGIYEFEYNGATGTVDLQGTDTATLAASNPLIAQMEELRKNVNGAPVTYVIADIDNRDGSEQINMYRVDLVDPDGTEISTTPATDLVSAWGDMNGGDYYNDGVAVYNELIETDVRAGRSGQIVLVFEDTVDMNDIVNVFVFPAGGAVDVPATLAE